MEFKMIIPPTGEIYISNDINSVRAYFIVAYKRLARADRIDTETPRCAEVLIYTPDTESNYAAVGSMVWVTAEDSDGYMGLKPGAYWCDYADTGGEITYSRRVAVNGKVNYNMDYDVRFT